MRYSKLGQTISIPYRPNIDYSIEARIKSDGRDTDMYTVTLLLVDHDTYESWTLDEDFKAKSKHDKVFMCVTDSIEQLMKRGYFDDYIRRWEDRKSIFSLGIEALEGGNV